MGSIRNLYEEAIRLYNLGDIDGYASVYADDALMTLPNGTFQGRAAIRQEWERVKFAFPDQTLSLATTLEEAATFADEFTWVATNIGPLVLADGTELPATGKRVEFRGMELVQVRNGKVAVHHAYWDTTAVFSQLGLLPEPRPAIPKAGSIEADEEIPPLARRLGLARHRSASARRRP